MADRYYSAQPIAGPTVTLSGGEAHHLLHVMRAAPGLAVVVFDGHGGEFAAEVTRCGRTEVELSVGPRQDVERELPLELTLAVPLPKGDRQRWLIEKTVELGVSLLIPLRTARSEGVAVDSAAKLARYVIEASKQCGRNRLMEIAPAVEWSALARETGKRRIVAHPGGWPLGELSLMAADTLVAVGPEGGFTDEEIAQATSGDWQVIDLGSRILRVETAALTIIAALSVA